VNLCVYAIAGDNRVPSISGISLRAIGAGRVWAIVAPARRAPDPTPSRLRRYHRIVTAIADQSAATLPARFGTIMDEAELMVVLRSRKPALTSALRHVRGHVQMTMRVLDVRRAPALASTQQRGAAPQSGRDYLRQRAAATSSRKIPGFAPVRDALGRWVRDEHVDQSQGVASVYHLVGRRAVNAYLRAAEAAIGDSGLRVVLSGPFPPYAFTSW
jgi:hypothetical protein